MNTVSNAAIKDLVDTCLDLDELSESELAALEVYPSTLQDPQLRCSEQLLINIWTWLDQHASQKDLGLQIGGVINGSAKGLLASWVSQANTLGEALAIFRENISLMNPSESWQVTRDAVQGNDYSVLTFNLDNKKGYPVMAIERSLSAMVTWGRALCGQRFEVERASFSFSKPSYWQNFEPLFGRNLDFGAEHNQLVIKRQVLELPVVSRNQFLKEMMEKAASKTLLSLDNHISLKEKVIREISSAWASDAEISAQRICSALSLSRQTLFRKLKVEGYDFKTLADDFKKERALELLQDRGNNITSVGLRLGYQDSSSFTKAFKRWYGITPTVYLNRLN